MFLSLVAVVAFAALLAVCAFSLVSVPGDAASARRALAAAASSLREGDVAAAREQVTTARAHIDDAQDSLGGWRADILGFVPWLGTPVDDARHLVQALDDAVSMAEIGVEVYPEVSGKNATLFTDKQIDRPTLDRVIAGLEEIGTELESADAELAEVDGTTPLVGDRISDSRDEAASMLGPINDAFADVVPMLDELPAFFGFEGERSYLIAMLNPSELRYSGGAALAFAPMTWDDGVLEVGESLRPVEDGELRSSCAVATGPGQSVPPREDLPGQLDLRPVVVGVRGGAAAGVEEDP